MTEINEVTEQVQGMDLKGSDNDENETSSDSEEDIRVAKVFQNPSIIEKIYENVGSFEDRKSCLLINSHWYKECAGKFQQEGMVNFKSLEDLKEFTDLLPSRLLKMGHTNFRFDTSMNLCASVEIVKGNDGGGGGDAAGGMDERTIIGKFLGNFATKTKALEAAIIWRSTKELSACLNQFVNLEDLTLYFFKTATPFEFPLGGEITLPKVKKLSVYHHFDDVGEVRLGVGERLQPFIPGSFPAMEYFSFRKWRKYEILGPSRSANYSSFYFEFYAQLYWNFNTTFNQALKARQDLGCQNLKGITLDDCFVPFETQFAPHRRLPYKLEQMELSNPYWLQNSGAYTQFTCSNLKSFLLTHGSKLRVFKIPITLYKHAQLAIFPAFPDGIIRIPLEFPPLPQLEKLDLIFLDYMQQVEAFHKIKKNWPIEFPPLSYSEMFPKLKKLNLMIQAKKENVLWVQNIHDHFMPSDAELEGIEVNLKIWVVIPPNHPKNKKFRHESWSTALMKRMSSHPNVKKEIFSLKEEHATF